MRCPSCGALNPDDASWCGQCYAPTAGVDPPAVERDAPAADAPRPRSVDPGTALGAPDAAARDVRTVAGEVEWRCGACGRWSPLARDRCATCGGPRRGFGGDTSERSPPPERVPRLVAVSVLAPGLGHLLAGRVGTGLARVVLWASWLIGGLALLAASRGTSTAPVAAAPPLLGALVVWLLTVADARDLATPSAPERLRPRVLTWITVAVVGSLALALLVTTGLGAA